MDDFDEGRTALIEANPTSYLHWADQHDVRTLFTDIYRVQDLLDGGEIAPSGVSEANNLLSVTLDSIVYARGFTGGAAKLVSVDGLIYLDRIVSFNTPDKRMIAEDDNIALLRSVLRGEIEADGDSVVDLGQREELDARTFPFTFQCGTDAPGTWRFVGGRQGNNAGRKRNRRWIWAGAEVRQDISGSFANYTVVTDLYVQSISYKRTNTRTYSTSHEFRLNHTRVAFRERFDQSAYISEVWDEDRERTSFATYVKRLGVRRASEARNEWEAANLGKYVFTRVGSDSWINHRGMGSGNRFAITCQ